MLAAVITSFLALVLGFVATFWALIDHLVLRRRLREVRRSNVELQRAIRNQGTLAKEVAHELKNPITAVVCAAETLELILDDTLDASNRSTLRHIKEYGDHVLKVMQDFIDLSRGVAGDLTSCKQKILVGDAVESVVGLLAPSAGRKGISIDVESVIEELAADIDPKHLKQILFNLIHNSIKFTPNGGNVVVSLETDSVQRTISVVVRDTGTGIAEAELQSLFHPVRFHRRQGRAPEEGCRLGLALTKTLTELEGGTLLISSVVGTGTTATVTFPKGEIPISEPAAVIETVAEVQPFAGQAVLLVDSDPGVRDVVSRLIETLGGAVDGVSMAVDALQALRLKSYSVVMIDESADGLQGCELAQMLRQDPSFKHTRIVLASSQPVDTALARDSGADRCIEKPLNSKVLIESLLQTH